MASAFIPISDTGRASPAKRHSISTASATMARMRAGGQRSRSLAWSSTAKSVCMPSSRAISSFEKHSPGSRPWRMSFSQ